MKMIMDPSLVSFLPAHGLCLTNVPFIITASAFLNLAIAVSYFILAFVLYCLKKKLSKIPYVDTFLWLWVSFVSLCALTHVSKVINLYYGGFYYYIDLVIHIMTAVVSAASAFLMCYYKGNIFTALNSYMDADCTECYDQTNINPSKKITFHKK